MCTRTEIRAIKGIQDGEKKEKNYFQLGLSEERKIVFGPVIKFDSDNFQNFPC